MARSAVVLWSVLIALGVVSAAASAHKHNPRPLVLHPRFHVVGSALTVETDGPFVLLLTLGVDGRDATGTLIDGRTETKTTVSYPGCYLPVFGTSPLFGGPWLMFSCAPSAAQESGGWELYNLYTGEWKAVVPNPPQDPCTMDDYCGVGVAGFGAQWIEWQQVPCRYCTAHYFFQNIDTGQLSTLPGWRSGGRIIPDLNSQSLAETLCPPLRAPTPGLALPFYGSFALAGDVLERCGSRLTLIVGNHNYPGVVANSRAVVWTQGPNSRSLEGLFLPSLRRFVITTPSTSPYDYGFALSSRELYVIAGTSLGESSGLVYATPAPTHRHRSARARHHH